MENGTNRIIEAGVRYQSMLEKFKAQVKDYARFRSHIGTLEMRVLEGESEAAMTLPDLPPISECTSKIAENLLLIAENLVYRPNRISVTIDRDQLPSYSLAHRGDDEFSPERFAKEISDQLFGANGSAGKRSAVKLALDKVFAGSLESGCTPVMRGIKASNYNGARFLDAVSSMRAFEVISAIATLIETEDGSAEALRSFDDWLCATDRLGRASLPSASLIGDDQYHVNMSIRRQNLFIRPSKALARLIKGYAA